MTTKPEPPNPRARGYHKGTYYRSATDDEIANDLHASVRLLAPREAAAAASMARRFDETGELFSMRQRGYATALVWKAWDAACMAGEFISGDAQESNAAAP
jgi:hypothetical protein